MTTQEEHTDDSALAGEYVLHLLDHAERSAFEARLLSEPDLRNLVRDWEGQLALLTHNISPVDPPAYVKKRLQSALFPQSAPVRGSFWRWIAGGAVATSVVVAALLFVPELGSDRTFEPSFTASIAADDGGLVVAARYISQTATLEISRQTGDAVPGRVLELWLIAEGAAGPVSLGVLPQDREALIDVPTDIAGQIAGGVLAISDEPSGGSPTGAPTGAVLAVGPVTEV